MVHDIIMDEREVVKDFYGESCRERLFTIRPVTFCRKQEQNGPESFAFPLQDVPSWFVEFYRLFLVYKIGKCLIDECSKTLYMLSVRDFHESNSHTDRKESEYKLGDTSGPFRLFQNGFDAGVHLFEIAQSVYFVVEARPPIVIDDG